VRERLSIVGKLGLLGTFNSAASDIGIASSLQKIQKFAPHPE
jgi:hypothetical protein